MTLNDSGWLESVECSLYVTVLRSAFEVIISSYLFTVEYVYACDPQRIAGSGVVRS